ncbi:PREDICTED: juxtaposed with another zinc finger protein 1 [Haliaeetus leucocephalus]|uniref:juxtaposed with another zinc finger protein 1 n=1 Tax=Haliaeetus leucocephalus TaxID=52644 RepID=UPI00053CD52C|nr:PREDICTED: juxtaposed with another zinc finger protein 1 [Haliaeetus leucocephalus]
MAAGERRWRLGPRCRRRHEGALGEVHSSLNFVSRPSEIQDRHSVNLVVGERNVCTDVLTKPVVSLGDLCVGSSPQRDPAQKDTDPRVLEKQELQQPTYVALSYINRFMTDAARREQESLKKKIQPKLSLTLSSTVSRGNVSTPPRHSSGSLTPPVTPPITPSSSFRSSTPTGSEYDEEEVDYEESDSDESWTTESAISSEAILSSMCMNGGDEKPFACPVPGCKKRYKNVNGIKYHAKNGHRTQIRVRKPFKCRCGKSYKTAQGLRHHTINFHPPVSAEIIRKMQQ